VENKSADIVNLLNALHPITLEEMSGIRLMNRTDTKYIMSADKLPLFIAEARQNYFVQEINTKRISTYHTIYWDTVDYAMFIAHQNGKRVRQKVRVRTYTDTELSFLEIKNKNNRGRTNKKRIVVAGTDILECGEACDFLHTHAWHTIHELDKNIENYFNRITLVNRNKTERLTVDFDIRFRNLKNGLTAELENLVIVELKRDGYAESPIRYTLRKLNVKPVSISKYCVGCIITTPNLKHNRFKDKLIQINKLTNRIIYG